MEAGSLRTRYYDPCWHREELSCVLEFLAGSDLEDSTARLAKHLERLLGLGVIPTDSGRTAIGLGLRAIGIGRGDEVLVPSYVCPAVVTPLLASGCSARFVDVDHNLCPPRSESLEQAVTDKTKALMIIHQFGMMADVEGLVGLAEEKNLSVVDDAGSAFGAKRSGRVAGTAGVFGVFSFGPGKIISSTGGGALICRDEHAVTRATRLLVRRRRFSSALEGLSAVGGAFPITHLDDVSKVIQKLPFSRQIQYGDWHGNLGRIGGLAAAVAQVQLRRYPQNREKRKRNCEAVCDILEDAGQQVVIPPLGDENAMQELPLILPSARTREAILKEAKRAGYELETGWRPLHHLDRFSSIPRADLSYTEDVWGRVLLLPVHPKVSEEDAAEMARICASYIR